jgi:hypothetical protein
MTKPDNAQQEIESLMEALALYSQLSPEKRRLAMAVLRHPPQLLAELRRLAGKEAS